MSLYTDQLRKTFCSTIEKFLMSYPFSSKQIITSVDDFVRTCAIYVWSNGSFDLEKCLEGINQIHSLNDRIKTYSLGQIQSDIERFQQGEFTLTTPPFFKDIVDYDVKNDSNYSRLFVACLEIVLIAFAMIDERIGRTEAESITSIKQVLYDVCDESNVKQFNNPVDVNNYISAEKHVPRVSITPYANTEDIIRKEQGKDNKERIVLTSKSNDTKAIEQLNQLVGLSEVKKEIKGIADFVSVQSIRKERGLPVPQMSYHLVFTGNPGTGKTTVARLVAQIYKELGVLSSGHLVETSSKDLVAGYVGQTAIKTSDVINEAQGGVLFIDEAYTLLDKNGQGFGQEAIDTLLKEMEDKRGSFAVIVAGYDELMDEFINSNPGLKSRFNKFIHFDDYSSDELLQIFKTLCDKGAYRLTEEASEKAEQYFKYLIEQRSDDFANARTVRNIFEKTISNHASRITAEKDKTEELLSTIAKDDIPWDGIHSSKEETVEDIINELSGLIGLDTIKSEVSDLVFLMQNRQRRLSMGLPVPDMSLHLVFTGNPGTGKTTVARFISRIYKALGVLSKGQLIEVDRSNLVAGYVGQTAIKTKEIIDSAIGGVLFIDEAYTLAGGNTSDYGQEAIDTLLKAMEDHRDNLVVIVAGYDELMEQFIDSNPGLESRFNRYIHFDDYSSQEMSSIFSLLCNRNKYRLTDEANVEINDYFNTIKSGDIGNGRGVRNLFERVVTEQAKRTQIDKESEIDLINKDDVRKAIEK